MNSVLFLDSSYVIALAVTKDQYHEKSLLLKDKLNFLKPRLVTTKAVLIEIGDSLSKQNSRRKAIQVIRAIELNENIEIISITDDLYAKAFDLYQSRLDKDWGMTDCISFIVMKDRNIDEALTADEHFIQASFKALLLQS